jgi:riboflavin synthase
MFTGIITHQAEVYSLEQSSNTDLLLVLKLNVAINHQLIVGSSIACNGICLTLIKIQQITEQRTLLSFQASLETISKTTIANWQPKQLINLEFSLKLGDELGGHLVLGHVDTTTEISTISPQNESWMFIFKKPINQGNLIAKKGSIAIDGVSLTVNDVDNCYFSINIIRHTFFHTNFQFLQAKNQVNLEFDPLARYIGNYLQNQNLFYEKKH